MKTELRSFPASLRRIYSASISAHVGLPLPSRRQSNVAISTRASVVWQSLCILLFTSLLSHVRLAELHSLSIRHRYVGGLSFSVRLSYPSLICLNVSLWHFASCRLVVRKYRWWQSFNFTSSFRLQLPAAGRDGEVDSTEACQKHRLRLSVVEIRVRHDIRNKIILPENRRSINEKMADPKWRPEIITQIICRVTLFSPHPYFGIYLIGRIYSEMRK